MRYVPASPGGMTIRSTCGPRMQPDRGLVAALVDDRGRRRRAPVNALDQRRRRRRSRRGGRGRRSTRLRRRNEPAGSIERDAGRAREAVDDRRSGASRPCPAASGRGRSSSRAMPSRMSASVFADSPRRLAQAAALGGLRAGRRSSRCRARRGAGGRSSGPSPGIRSSSTRLGRDLRPRAARRRPSGRSSRARAILSLMASPTPGDPRRRPGPVGRDEVDRAAPDGVGRAVVGDGLEDELALDLEHVADLVEDPGEVAVGQVGRSSAGVVGHGPDGSRRHGGDDPVRARSRLAR